MNLPLWLLGGARLRADAQDRVEILNLCLSEGISYTDLCREENGDLRFRCSYAAARALLRKCRARGLALACERVEGIPSILWRLRRRWGLVLGMICAVVLVAASGAFVWDVSVTGNETMTEREIELLLSECGFGVGSYLPDARVREIENRVLIVTDRLSWISINLDGTVAQVQVIERIAQEEQAPTRPANLVAACDGQIELIKLYRGGATVKIGQAVKKGELLVSGVLGNETEGLRITRAAGEILARTEREIVVEIPLTYEKKSVTDETLLSATLNFFNFSLKIFKNTGNDTGQCDIIEKERELPSFGARRLPLSLTLQVALPYTVEVSSRSAQEAVELAYSELDAHFCALADTAQILEKRIVTEITDSSVILRASVSCIENIATVQEFDVEP